MEATEECGALVELVYKCEKHISLVKSIKSGVLSLGIKVERHWAQGWVCTLWLTAM